jgi:hypothetical protein
MERPILDHQRNLEPLAVEVQVIFGLISEEVEPRQPGIDAQPCDAERVVVVPERRRRLVVRVVIDLCREERTSLSKAVGEPRFGITVAVR